MLEDTMQRVVRAVFGGGANISPANPLPTTDVLKSGLYFYGVVTAVPGANQFTIPTLAGLGAGKFSGTNPYQAFVFRDAGGISAAPQGEMLPITAYTTATGVFTTAAFTAAVAVGDEILIVHPSLAGIVAILADLAVPAIGSGANILERDVIGNKAEAPNFNTDNASIIYSLMGWVRGIARSKMVLVGNAEAGSNATTIVSAATLIQSAGSWRGQKVLMLDGLNVRLSRPIVAYSLGANSITVSPAFPSAVAAPDNFVILSDYQDPLAIADSAINLTPADVVGNKSDAAVTVVGVVASVIAYIKGLLNQVAAVKAKTDLTALDATVAKTTELISAGVIDFNATAKASIQAADAAALAAVAYTRQAGVAQSKATTIDLNQAAATYDLMTGTTQDVVAEKLIIRMSGGAVAGAVTSISIQTDDTTPQVFVSAVDGAVANLTDQNQLGYDGAIMVKAGKKIRLTIAGGAAGAAKVCDVVVIYRAVVSGGYLA